MPNFAQMTTKRRMSFEYASRPRKTTREVEEKEEINLLRSESEADMLFGLAFNRESVVSRVESENRDSMFSVAGNEEPHMLVGDSKIEPEGNGDTAKHT